MPRLERDVPVTDAKITVYSSFDDADAKKGARDLDRNGLSIPPSNRELEDRYSKTVARLKRKPDDISEGQKDWRADFAARYGL